MIQGERVIALIPLRGGSKSVKDKNLRPLGTKPLLAWPIETALNTPEIDRVIISTDHQPIAELGKTLGAEIYERPAALATDSALVIDVIRHLKTVLQAENEKADIMVLLEATSPFRSSAVVQRCLQRLITEKLDSIATFHEADLNPHRAWSIDNGAPTPFISGAIPWKPRQQLPEAYQLNGQVYAFRLSKLQNDSPSLLIGKMGAEIVDKNSVVDIDDEKDFTIANTLLQYV